MRHDTVDHVGDGLEAAMRCHGADRRSAAVHGTELVEQEERVGDVSLDAAGEGSPHGEPGALDGVVSGDDALDGRRSDVGLASQAGKDEGLSTVTAGMATEHR